MLKDRIISLSFLMLILLISIAVVSANENVTDDSFVSGDVDVGSFEEINEKIVNASENDVIELEGTYESSGNTITVTKSLTIDGKNSTTLDAKGLSGIFSTHSINMTFRNLKFINSKDYPIFSYDSKIIIDNCIFVNNSAPVFLDNGLLSNCLFENNTGCAVQLESNSKVINSTFKNNRALWYGGALSSYGNNISLICNTFIANQAKSGGALYISSTNTSIQGGAFRSNKAKNDDVDWETGGASIYIASDGVSISDVIFESNSAQYVGGAIYWQGNNGLAKNITLENNSAGNAYSAHVKGDHVSIINSSFSKNHNYDQYDDSSIKWIGKYGVIDGCAIQENYSSKYTRAVDWRGGYGLINNTLFNRNKGAKFNVAIYAYANHFTLANSNFTENTGALCNIRGDYTCIDNVNFNKNSVTERDLILFQCKGSYIAVKNSNFFNNTHKYGAPVLETFGKMTTVLNCSFLDNDASALRMVGYILDGCTFINNKHVALTVDEMDVMPFNLNTHVVKNSLFKDNPAGAISGSDRNLAVVNCEFTGNHAKNGGAIYWANTGAYFKNNTFKDNSAEKLGGAIYLTKIGNKLIDNVFTNNKASDFNNVYGDFEVAKIKNSVYVDQSVQFKVTDKTTKKAINGIHVVYDIYKGKKLLHTKTATTKNGIATIKLNGVAAGSYGYAIECSIIMDYIPTSLTVKKAPTVIKAPKLTAKHKKSKNFKITIKNKITKTPAKKVKIKVKIGKKTYKLTTDKNGVAKFNTKKLAKGKYNVKITSTNPNYKISKKSKIIIK